MPRWANSADPRIARAGRGAVLDFGEFPEDDEFPGLFGSIDGAQTAPCAELAALYYCLLYTQGPLEIWTDNALVYRGWNSRLWLYPRGPHKQWWQRIKQAILQRPDRISSVSVHKCNSHLDDVSLRFSSQPWYVT